MKPTGINTTGYSNDYLQAYAEFLLSERNRHLEDIVAIDIKLELLKSKGFIAEREGPWIKEEELR